MLCNVMERAALQTQTHEGINSQASQAGGTGQGGIPPRKEQGRPTAVVGQQMLYHTFFVLSVLFEISPGP